MSHRDLAADRRAFGQRGFLRRVPVPVALVLLATVPAAAQIPGISTLCPIGARAGTTVEVEVRGSSLEGAHSLLISGTGVSGTVVPGGSTADERYKPIWQAKCAGCHELRSPANRSMTPAQWAATVERMVKVRQAPLSADEADKVTQYLTSAARSGKVTARITVTPDALPGLHEVRISTALGISTACWFEVGNLPEVMSAPGAFENAQPIKLPCVANGCFAGNSERHYFRFAAHKGDRLVFNLKAFRYSEASQLFFNPALRLLDSKGAELAENHGYYELDPLIDWSCAADGDYVLEVRDLLGRGNPSSVYRLTMGAVPYDTLVAPAAVQAGVQSALRVVSRGGADAQYSLLAPADGGMASICSPVGPQRVYVTPYPVADAAKVGKTPVALPAALCGTIAKPGDVQTFTVTGSGDLELEAIAQRIGSPVQVRVTILDSAGHGVGGVSGDNSTRIHLQPGQMYTARVEATDGQGGPDHVYVAEIRPVKPHLDVVFRPANVTLRPGTSTPVQVIVTRRDGVAGDLVVTAEDLPSGVTFTANAMPPDRNEAWLVLSAAADAKPAAQPFRVVVHGSGPDGEASVNALPQELYKLNNQDRTIDRVQGIVAVAGQSDFTASFVTAEAVKVHPRKGVEVKVNIARRAGFRGAVTATLLGLPLGWVTNWETAGPDQNTLTLQVRPDGNNTAPFLNRDPKLTPIRCTLEAWSDDFRFAFGTALVGKADKIEEEKDNP